MTDQIVLEVDALHRGLSVAILSDGQQIQITLWLNATGECEPDDAASCVCGPCFDGYFYAVDLSKFTGAIIQ
jgi:hypothetical protein